MLATQLIVTEATKLGGSIKLLETGELSLLDKDGQGILTKGKNAFMTVKELADKAFAEANMLVVNTPTKQAATVPTAGTTQPPDLRQLKYQQVIADTAQHFQNQ